MNKFVNRIRKIRLETFCAVAFILLRLIDYLLSKTNLYRDYVHELVGYAGVFLLLIIFCKRCLKREDREMWEITFFHITEIFKNILISFIILLPVIIVLYSILLTT